MSKISICQFSLGLKDPLEKQIERCVAAGIPAISLYNFLLQGQDLKLVRQQLNDAGLAVSGLMPSGRFLQEQGLKAAIEQTLQHIDDAAILGAEVLYILPGSSQSCTFSESRDLIREGLYAVKDHAASAGVTLAMEPVHPIMANWNFVNTFRGALEVLEPFDDIGIALDVFHLWWDRDFIDDIARSGKKIKHVQMSDFVFDKGVSRVPVGEGVIPLARIVSAIQKTDFDGYYDIEVIGPCVKERVDTLGKDCRIAIEELLR